MTVGTVEILIAFSALLQ